MRSRWVMFAMTATLVGLLAGCGLFDRVDTIRYRITVEVDTPQGLRSGSSVWEVSTAQGSGIPDYSIHSRVRGEAVAVDLPGGTLFALLLGADMSVDYPAGLVVSHLRAHPEVGVPMGANWSENMRAVAKAKPAFELYPDEYPLLVQFRDIREPASVEKIEPTVLPTSFGPGVRLKRVIVALTDDSVTTVLTSRLPWLSKDRGSLLEAPSHTPVRDLPFASIITHMDFTRGLL